MMNKLRILSVGLCILYLLSLSGCTNIITETPLSGNVLEKMTELQTIDNRVSEYAQVKGKHYLGLNFLSSEFTMDKMSDSIPYGNPFMATVYGIASDGEYLYCHAWNLQYDANDANHFKRGIYRIDTDQNRVIPLHEWKQEGMYHDNYSIHFYDGYVYFFMSVGDTNQYCKVDMNGNGYEQLSDNNGSMYTGVIRYKNSYFYIQDQILYKASDEHLKDGIKVADNVFTMELYKDYFYYTSLMPNGFECQMWRLKADISMKPELILDHLCGDCYLLKDDYIYYCKYDPVVLAKNDDGQIVMNATQGCIYEFNISSGTSCIFVKNEEVNVTRIYNVSDEILIVRGNTNDQIENSLTEGLTINYYVINADTGTLIQIEDKTLILQGT